jgi:hypothetical protein
LAGCLEAEKVPVLILFWRKYCFAFFEPPLPKKIQKRDRNRGENRQCFRVNILVKKIGDTFLYKRFCGVFKPPSPSNKTKNKKKVTCDIYIFFVKGF